MNRSLLGRNGTVAHLSNSCGELSLWSRPELHVVAPAVSVSSSLVSLSCHVVNSGALSMLKHSRLLLDQFRAIETCTRHIFAFYVVYGCHILSLVLSMTVPKQC